jgi:hypothetical protein
MMMRVQGQWLSRRWRHALRVHVHPAGVLRRLRLLLVPTVLAVGVTAAGDGRRWLVLQGEALEGEVRERGREDEDVARGDERPRHRAADDLALRTRERHRDAPVGGAGHGRGHGRQEERGRDGEDLVPAAQDDDRGAVGGRREAERDVGDDAGPGQHADPEAAAAREARERDCHVAAVGDLEHVRPHRGRRLHVLRDHRQRLQLVLRPRRPPTPPLRHLHRCPVTATSRTRARRHRSATAASIPLLLLAVAAAHLVREALHLLLLPLAAIVMRQPGEVRGDPVLAASSSVKPLPVHVTRGINKECERRVDEGCVVFMSYFPPFFSLTFYLCFTLYFIKKIKIYHRSLSLFFGQF